MSGTGDAKSAAAYILERLEEGIGRAQQAGLDKVVELLKQAQEEARRAVEKK